MEVPGLLALFAQNIKLTNGSLIARSACASEIPPACSSPQIWPCLIVLPRGACIYSAGTVLFLFLPPGTVFFWGLVVGATQWPRSGACLPACLSVCLSVFLFLFFFFLSRASFSATALVDCALAWFGARAPECNWACWGNLSLASSVSPHPTLLGIV